MIDSGGLPVDVALRQMFDWFDANGGTNRTPWLTELPGVNTRIEGTLDSAHVREFTVGLSRRLGARGVVRADVVRRVFRDFYVDRTDTTTGTVTNDIGQTFDLTLVENSNAVKREYTALNLQASYRLSGGIRAGGNYTLSKLFGNVNGENIRSGPLTSSILQRPEYFDPAWSFPEGSLAADQRHRVRLWANVDLPAPERIGRLSLGILEQIQSGTPYGAVGTIHTQLYVDNPGYEQPSDTVNYFFTDRDAFRTATMIRTRFQPFNPFTTTPVQGTHWDYGDRFGEAIAADAYTVPRTFRFSVGVRF